MRDATEAVLPMIKRADDERDAREQRRAQDVDDDDPQFATVPLAPLDAVDVAIVRVLEHDSRVSILSLAKQVGVSRITAADRLGRLVDCGVISLRARVDYRQLGYLITAFVGLQTAQTPTEVDIVMALQRVPEVEDIYTVTGEYDMLLKVRARSPEHLRHLLVFKISTIPNVQRTVTMLALASHQEGAPVCVPHPPESDAGAVESSLLHRRAQ